MFIKTKRFLYDVMIERIERVENKFVNSHDFIAVLGARKVGKTVLFQQLTEYYGDKAYYFDCSNIDDIPNFYFKTFYENLYEKGIRYLFLDEVCKVNVDHYADFIQFTKLYYAGMTICITGSVKLLVEKISADICRGIDYELPHFLYTEKLCWDNGLEKIDIDFIKDNTSNDNLIKYLKNQMLNNEELIEYMKGSVNDTISSYRRRTAMEDLVCNFSDDTLINALKYISFTQLIYKGKDNNFVDLPSIDNTLREKIFEDYSEAKSKYHLKNEDIEEVLGVLLGSGLARRIYFRNETNFTKCESIDSKIPAILFEYPWFSNVCLNTEVQNCKELQDQWVEYIILLRASYLYENSDKLRVNFTDEVDLIYKVDFYYAGIEIKNKPYKNNKGKYINRIKSFAEGVGLKEFLLSSNDSINRNDKIVICLELEYINVLREGTIWSTKTIGQLLKEYNI